jgi:hypothetical protein
VIEFIAAVGVVAALLAAFARLAARYPINTRDLIEGSIVGGHARAPQSLWPSAATAGPGLAGGTSRGASSRA